MPTYYITCYHIVYFFYKNKNNIGRAAVSCMITMDMRVDTGATHLGLPLSVQCAHHAAFGNLLQLSGLRLTDL